jgi:hypothetical protein
MTKPFEDLLMHHYAGRGSAYALAFSLILAKIHHFDQAVAWNGFHRKPACADENAL